MRRRDKDTRANILRPCGAPQREGLLPYEFVAHTYSSLTFTRGWRSQLRDRRDTQVSASLLEYEAPPGGRASVWAEVEPPGGAALDIVTLTPGAGGRYAVSLRHAGPGVYTFRVRARGETMRGQPYEREQTLTGVAVPGGYRWSPDDPKRDVLCELLDCLRRTGAIGGELQRRLEAIGIKHRCADQMPRQQVSA